jgi:cupin fold WbuC family metalloprotein
MTIIDEALLNEVSEQAKTSPRLRMNHNFHQSLEDKCHRFLNAVEPGTVVPIHKHPMSNENVILIKGKLDEVLYEEVPSADGKVTLKETERIHLCPEEGAYGCQVPKGVWHTVEALESGSVILEVKDGAYEPI